MDRNTREYLVIRRGLPDDAATLSAIAFTAKAHWGYPEEWMESWRPQFEFSPGYFIEYESWVAVLDDTPIAFYTLQERDRDSWLENLWVLPEYMGRGLGRKLFLHAVARSRKKGFSSLRLKADPNAKGFYEKMGMHQAGVNRYDFKDVERILPIMEMKL